MNESKKLAIIVSDIDKAVAFEWTALYLDKSKYSIYFILINSENSYLHKFLTEKNFKVYTINYTGKLGLLKSIVQCAYYLKKEKANIVHCHLFEASFIGIVAGFLSNINKRIYTRHYSLLLHYYYPKSVYIDKLVNRLATHIVAISKVVEDTLINKENARRTKIRLIYHGFAIQEFDNINNERIDQIRKKYDLINKGPVVGVISRYTELKGIQFIIPAFKNLLKKFPNACLVLANANGPYVNELHKLLSELPTSSYREIKFENDFIALYKTFDIFIHTPIDSQIEAFGQTYVEALAAKIPSIFTLSGVANEFIVDNKNALVVSYKTSSEIYEAMDLLLTNRDLSNTLRENGYKSVCERFSLDKMIKNLESIYDE